MLIGAQTHVIPANSNPEQHRGELITDKEGIDVEQPELGSLNINDIEDSDYFFA